MAKFVIAGEAGCSLYARAEMLGDTLTARLPHFKATKVVMSIEEWPNWLTGQCERRGWSHSKGSPLVWRELVDTGGKGLYLGGLAEFEEYAMKYHNIAPPTDTCLENKIAEENLETYQQQQLQEEERKKVLVQPMKVCVTNCSNPIAYHLAQLVACGAVMGPSQKVALCLYDSQYSSVCDSLATELMDLASPLLEYAAFTPTLLEAFDGIDMAFILDYPYCAHNLEPSSSEGKRMELCEVATLFQNYASALDFGASKNVKVIVSGVFANMGTSLLAFCASSLFPSCFVAAPCLAESQAKAVLANRLQLNSSNIKQLAIWGRTHGPVIADHTLTRVAHFPGAVVGPDPFDLPLLRCEFDREWLEKEFPKLVAARHNLLEGYREEGPSLAEAVGLAKLGCVWSEGDTTTWQSVGIVTNGQLEEVPIGVTCSLPCHCRNSKWEPIPDLAPPENIKEELSLGVAELQSDLETAATELDITLDTASLFNRGLTSTDFQSTDSEFPHFIDYSQPRYTKSLPNTKNIIPDKSPNLPMPTITESTSTEIVPEAPETIPVTEPTNTEKVLESAPATNTETVPEPSETAPITEASNTETIQPPTSEPPNAETVQPPASEPPNTETVQPPTGVPVTEPLSTEAILSESSATDSIPSKPDSFPSRSESLAAESLVANTPTNTESPNAE